MRLSDILRPSDAPAPGAPDSPFDPADLEDQDVPAGVLANQTGGFARQDPNESLERDGQPLVAPAQGAYPLATGQAPRPVLVRVGPAEEWMADEVAVPSDAAGERCARLLGADERRRSLTITVTGALPVRIGRNEFEAGQLRGSFPLAAGSSIDLDSQAPVFVQGVGGTSSVAFLVTFDGAGNDG